MLSAGQIIALAFALTAPALASQASPTVLITTNMADRPLGTALAGALDLKPTNGPNVLLPRDGVASVTINLVNSMTAPVSIFYASNAPAPGQPQISLQGDPQPGTIDPAATTQVIMPQGWAGRGTVGLDGDDAQGTKWEASLTSDSDFQPFIDVSYVDGYSIPMTCSCQGSPISGCNIELWDTGIACPAAGAGPVCYNPAQQVPDGPAPDFFTPCAGAAYTYPNDNIGTSGCADATEFDCCVGTACPAPGRQAQAPPPVNSSRMAKTKRRSRMEV